MRTIIDIPDDHLQALADVCEREGISRSEAIRRAIAIYLRKHVLPSDDQAFGIWANRSQPAAPSAPAGMRMQPGASLQSVGQPAPASTPSTIF